MVCKLCLSSVCEYLPNSEESSSSLIKTLLADVLPQVSEVFSNQYPVCEVCVGKLQEMKAFKEQCLNMEQKIIIFRNSSSNLRQNRNISDISINDVFYHYERSKVREDICVCRTCFKPACAKESYSLHGNTTYGVSLKCLFPELDLTLTSNPVMCKHCVDISEDLYQFQQKCYLVQSALMDVSFEEQFLLNEDIACATKTSNLLKCSNSTAKIQPIIESELESVSKNNNEKSTEENDIGIEDYLNYMSNIKGRELNSNYSSCENDLNSIENIEFSGDCDNTKSCNCPLCIETRKWERNLKENIISEEPDDPNVFKCGSCKYKTLKKHYLTRHIRILHKKDCKITYKCMYCEFSTKIEENLGCHVKLEHDKICETYKCSRCEFKTKWESLLNLHNVIKHDDECDNYQCPFCKFKTGSKEDFKTHNKYKHNDGIRTFDCLYCEYKTRYKCHLKTHIKAKHDEDMSNFHKCVYCGYKTRWKSSLLMHIRLKHAGDNQLYECIRCSFRTKKLRRLKIHRKLEHEGNNVTPYIEYRNKIKAQMKVKREQNSQQQKNHTNITEAIVANKDSSEVKRDMHKCVYCDYRSKRRDTLQRHISAKHDNEIEYINCPDCEYKTKRKDALKRHADVKHPKFI